MGPGIDRIEHQRLIIRRGQISPAISIGVFIISDAGMASLSRFHRAATIFHDYAGIAFTFRWNPRS
jgi:hypothetical protein